MLGLPAPVLFDPQNREFAPTMNKSLQALAAGAMQDPTVGLYSATNQKLGFSIQTQLADGLIDIIAGRRPMTDYDQLVAAWRSPAATRSDRSSSGRTRKRNLTFDGAARHK